MTSHETSIGLRGLVSAGLAIIALLLTGLLLWAARVQISGAIIQEGTVQPGVAQAGVRHRTGGSVAHIAVSEGDSVAKGDLLLALDGRQARTELRLLEEQRATLRAEADRHLSLLEGRSEVAFDIGTRTLAVLRGGASAAIREQARLFVKQKRAAEAALTDLDLNQNKVRPHAVGLVARRAALRAQLDFAREEIADQRSLLARGLASSRPLNALRREEVRLIGALAEVEAAITNASADQELLSAEALEIEAQARLAAAEGLSRTGHELRRLAGKATLIRQRIADLEVRAPVSGWVHDLRVAAPGTVLRPHEEVLQIIPEAGGRSLVAMVPPGQIEGLSVGQGVEIKLARGPQGEERSWRGRVSQISATTLTNDQRQEARYRVTVLLPPQDREAQALRPGITVQLFFQTQARTPLSFLVQPVSDYFERAFREN